jgi:hypothetical protein
MNTGAVSFTASSPLRIGVAAFEVAASDNASGNVTIMSSTTGGVKALKGTLTVRNTKTSESFRVKQGEEILLGLTNGTHVPSLGQLASNSPSTIPAPTLPSSNSARRGLSQAKWFDPVVLGGLGVVGTLAVVAIHKANENSDDIKSLGGKFTTLSNTVTTNQTTTAATLKTLQSAAALASNLQAQSAALSQTISNSQAALDILTANGQGNSASATALRTAITSANTQLSNVASLFGQVGSCQANPTTCNTSTLFTSALNQNGLTNGAINTGNSGLQNAKTANPNLTGLTGFTNVGNTGNPSSVS